MKLTAAILLFLIVFSSLFYYGYFDAILFHSKEEAKFAIAEEKGTKDFKLVKIPLRIQRQNKQDEIWYCGKLYDVVKTEIIKDTVYEYLYHDKNEENVLSEINDFFKSGDDSFLPASSSIPLLKAVHKIPEQFYTFSTNAFSVKIKTTFPKNFSEEKFYAYNNAPEIPTPPPRHFIL